MNKKVKNKPIFVCLIGIDGSGKTAHAKLILRSFQERKIPAKYVWLRPRTLLIAPLRFIARKTILKGENIKSEYTAYHDRRQRYALKCHSLRKIYYAIALLDYLVLAYWNLLPYLTQRLSIICDRYIYDLVINMGEILGYSAQGEIKLLRKLLAFFPHPDLVIVCDVDEEVALQRKSDTPHISYLRTCRPKYKYLAKFFNFPIVDTSFSLEKTTGQVSRIIEEHIQARNEI